MEKEAVEFNRNGATLTARINCEIDQHTARGIRERIDKEIFLERPSVVRLDFSGVRFMDSSGIALILGRLEVAEAVGRGVQLSGMCPSVMKLVRLAGIDRIDKLTVIP